MYAIIYFSLSPCLPSPPHFPAPPAALIWYWRGGRRRRRRWRMRPTNSGGFLLVLASIRPSLPSLPPPTRIPSSESHHALASVFAVELQEDEGERRCVPSCNKRQAKFIPSPPSTPLSPSFLFTSFTFFHFTFTHPSTILLYLRASLFLYSLCCYSRSHKVHITVQIQCVYYMS